MDGTAGLNTAFKVSIVAGLLVQCSVCKRTKLLIENVTGINLLASCTITSGCRGRMGVVKQVPYVSREQSPSPEENLTDWSARTVLHAHTQSIKSKTWRIVHDVTSPAVVEVLIDGVIRDRKTYKSEVLGQGLILLEFEQACIGTAQLLSRNGTVKAVQYVADTTDLIQVSANGRVVFLDSTISLTSGGTVYNLELTLPDGTVMAGEQQIDTTSIVDTSWSDASGVLVNDVTQHKAVGLRLDQLFAIPSLGTIPDGSVLSVEFALGSAPLKRQIFIGLAKAANSTSVYMKNKDQAIDVAVSGLVYQRGELFVRPSDILTLIPPLRVITQ